jgi:hypothetical protein
MCQLIFLVDGPLNIKCADIAVRDESSQLLRSGKK